MIYDLHPLIHEGSEEFFYHAVYSPSESLVKSLRGEDDDIDLLQSPTLELAKVMAEAYYEHVHMGQTIPHEKGGINLNGTVPSILRKYPTVCLL